MFGFLRGCLMENGGPVRLLFYILFFGFFIFLESRIPLRKRKINPADRWAGNLGLTTLNTIFLRLVFLGTTASLVRWLESYSFGLFQSLPVPDTFSLVFSIICLDWTSYYLHRNFHAFPFLWKFHRVHHTDLEVDATTATRFHLVELLAVLALQSLIVVLLGVRWEILVVYWVLLNTASLFAHSNLKLPARVDEILRFVLVTPGMHLIHHSLNPKEHHRNFGFIFSVWDRLFGTYLSTPERDPDHLQIGLDIFNQPEDAKWERLVQQPFLKRINRGISQD